jgi:hypothetical protein
MNPCLNEEKKDYFKYVTLCCHRNKNVVLQDKMCMFYLNTFPKLTYNED